MLWKIILAVFLVIFAMWLGAAWYFFSLFIKREKVEKTEEQQSAPGTQWYEFREALEEGQKILYADTSELVEILSCEGLKLKAFLVPADTDSPKGTCILFHGYHSLATVDFAPEIKFLHDLGYRLLVPYQRSHGLSEGKYVTFGSKERLDCKSWAEYAASTFGGDIFLMGISMGCVTVLRASELELPETVRGIVGDCGFTSSWEFTPHVMIDYIHIPAWLTYPIYFLVDIFSRIIAGFSVKEDTRKALARSSVPILFIHGEADDFVPADMTYKNFEACTSEKELMIVPKADHAKSYCTDPAGYEKKVEEFLASHSS